MGEILPLVYDIAQGILTFAEIAGAFCGASWFFEERITGWRRVPSFLIVLGLGSLTVFQRSRHVFYSRDYLVFCIAVSVLLIFIVFQRQHANISLFTTLYFVTVYSLHLGFYMICTAILPDYHWHQQVFVQNGPVRILIYALALALVWGILFAMRRRREWCSAVFENMKLLWCVIILLEYAAMKYCDIVTTPWYQDQGLENAERILLLLPFVLPALAGMVIWQMYRSLVERQSREREAYALRLQAAESVAFGKRKAYHDTKNQMIVLRNMLQQGRTEDAKAFLDQHFALLNTEDAPQHSPVFSFLAEKEAEAKAAGIEVAAEYEEEAWNMETQELADWCALFGNLWDNAIEGCKSLPDPGWICFRMQHKVGFLLIHISNSCPQRKMAGKLPETSKKDRENHGMGFLSIQYVVDKYDGNMEWACEDGVFEVDIAFNFLNSI
ncbi:MAG: ATP-binding protein [Lachnospiraceae bacterium]|nr:ATP-binding protein [Lachnospiraceae bacterium]